MTGMSRLTELSTRINRLMQVGWLGCGPELDVHCLTAGSDGAWYRLWLRPFVRFFSGDYQKTKMHGEGGGKSKSKSCDSIVGLCSNH